MSHHFRPAKRDQVQLILGLAGASGSGKTYSLLQLATGLAYPEASNAAELNRIIEAEGRSRIAFVDTERGRALHYAPPPGEKPDPWRAGGAWYSFDHCAMEPPFSPTAYSEIIEAADDAGYRVIIADSFSHEWAGEGGVLEFQEAEFQRMGARDAVKMASWIKPKMAHKKMVGRITTLRAHLLVGLRAEQKVKMVQEKNADGSPKGRAQIIAATDLPTAERWSPVCDKSFPFELTISLVVGPEAPGFPHIVKLQDQHRPYVPLDRPLSVEVGKALASWAGGAKAPATGETRTRRDPEELLRVYIEAVQATESLTELAELEIEKAAFLSHIREKLPALAKRSADATAAQFAKLSQGPDSANESEGPVESSDSLFGEE